MPAGHTGAFVSLSVDIGMPTRGLGPYLREALDSVLAQTFTDWRLTVAENGAGDPELAAFLEPYLEDERITHVVRGRDLGMSENHSELVRAATAPYVALLHDDDYWLPSFLERRVEFLEQHPDCAFVFGGFTTIGENGEVLAHRRPTFSGSLVQPHEFVKTMLHANVVGMPTILVRRAAYTRAGDAFGDGFPMIDYEMWLRIGSRSPIGYLDVEDAAWRFHGTQRSASERRWGESWLAFYDAVDRTLDGTGIDVDRTLLRRRRTAAAICAALDALELGDKEGTRRHLKASVELSPRAVVDPRVVAAAVGLCLGRPGARTVAAARRSVKRARGLLGPTAARARTRLRDAKPAAHRLHQG